MNNAMEISSIGLPLLSKYLPYILSVIAFLLGWKLNNRLSDRQFLRNDIYSPLYKEINLIAENISNFENCYFTKSGKMSHPSVLQKKPPYVRKALLRKGQYKLIPEKLRKELDSYYERCEEYNKQLNNINEEIKKICKEELRRIKTEQNHVEYLNRLSGEEARNPDVHLNPKFLLKGVLPDSFSVDYDQVYLLIEDYNGWDSIITIDDLTRSSRSLRDLLEQLIELVDKRTTIKGLRDLQHQLKNPEELLKKIEKRIHNPNPLAERLGV